MSYPLNVEVIARPGYSGGSKGERTETEARANAYDYAMLLLDNDPRRTHVEVRIALLCWACEGAGQYRIKGGRRSVFPKLKPCHCCKGSGEQHEIGAYAVTRE